MKPKPISRMLPEIPEALQTPADRARKSARVAARMQALKGRVQIATLVGREEADYLVQAWGFKDRSQMMRVAMRYLLQQTVGGLTALNVESGTLPSQHLCDGGSFGEPRMDDHQPTFQGDVNDEDA